MITIWLFTTRGFYSAVENPANKAQVVVRARARVDLEALREYVPGLKIQSTPKRDYQYRSVLHKDVWQSIVAKLAAEIDYGNFKDAVKVGPGGYDRADTYTGVWATLLEIAWPRKRFGYLNDDFLDDLGSEEQIQIPLTTGVAPRPPRAKRKRNRRKQPTA